MTPTPTCPILSYSSVVNMDEGRFTDFENSYKINENSYEDNFFYSGDQEKKEIYISEKTKLAG